jgi:hypothetical protein
VVEELKNISRATLKGRAIPVTVLLVLTILLSVGSGLYAGASFFAQQAPNVTITTTIFTNTTSWATSTIWSTVTETVQGVLTTIEYTTSTNTITATVGGTPVIIDSYSETNRDNQQGIRSSGPTESGQAIASHTTAFRISSIRFYLKRVGSPTGLIYAKVYACSGTPGSTGVPTGASLGTSTGIDVSTVSTSWTLVEFTFPTPVAIGAGINYCVSASFTGGNVNNDVKIGLDGSSPSHSGNWFANVYTAYPAYDVIFYVYGNWT